MTSLDIPNNPEEGEAGLGSMQMESTLTTCHAQALCGAGVQEACTTGLKDLTLQYFVGEETKGPCPGPHNWQVSEWEAEPR